MAEPVIGILPRLLDLYQSEGMLVAAGFNPYREAPTGPFAVVVCADQAHRLKVHPWSHFESPTPLTPAAASRPQRFGWRGLLHQWARSTGVFRFLQRFRLRRQDPPPIYLSTGGGVAVDELYFLEHLVPALAPQHAYLLGIGAGWSTVALGLLAPQTRFVGLDWLSEGEHAERGFQLTRRLAERIGMQLQLHVGRSPHDVPGILGGGQPLDFAFIHGLHTNEQVLLDFEAVLPYLAPRCLVLFHDVLSWSMLEGWERIAARGRELGLEGLLLRRTASGMGVLYRDVTPAVRSVLEAFSAPPFLVHTR